MSESPCGDRVCSNLGCTDDCGLPAGSSVPEAARAAALAILTPEGYGRIVGVLDHLLEAAAPPLVAAAVAEERATTGRRDAERERYIKTLVKERDAAERKVRAVEAVTCWTNEDGKRFMFVDDVAAALEVPGSVATA